MGKVRKARIAIMPLPQKPDFALESKEDGIGTGEPIQEASSTPVDIEVGPSSNPTLDTDAIDTTIQTKPTATSPGDESSTSPADTSTETKPVDNAFPWMRLGQNLSSFAPSPFAPEAPPSWILNPIPPAPRWQGKRQAKVQAQSPPQPQMQATSSSQTPSDVQSKAAKVRLKVRTPDPLSKPSVLTSGKSGALPVDDSRIPRITPSKTRCLITNTSVPAASMVTQPVVSNDQLGLANFDTLRRQWCLPLEPPQTCIDRLGGNRLCLRGDWAAMLSNHGWTLIPQTQVLLDITRKLICLKNRKKNAHPCDVIQHKPYVYTFIALQLEGIQITRQTAGGDEVFSPPYADFPSLLLPLHPYLAIYHALVAFDKHEPVTDEHILIHNNLLRIRKLWEELEWYRDKTLVNLALKKDTNSSAQDKVDEKRKIAVDPYPTPAKRACHP